MRGRAARSVVTEDDLVWAMKVYKGDKRELEWIVFLITAIGLEDKYPEWLL